MATLSELKARLETLAKIETWTDDDEDFIVWERAGGNMDDAYWGGESDGRVNHARDLLNEFKDLFENA